MLLAIDVGNSNTNIGVSNKNSYLFIARITTDSIQTEDQLAVELSSIFRLYGMEISDVSGAIVSSVVPPLTPIIRKSIKMLIGRPPLLVGPGIKTGLNILIDNPGELGADLVAGAVAAGAMFPKPCIIFDFGTASKATVLDKSGNCLGGSIAPGMAISLEALSQRAAQLPHINLEDTSVVIGTNTVDCMKSGTVLGTASMIDGMAERIEGELGEKATLVATGGLHELVIPHCKRDVISKPTLILDGLRIIYERNKK